MSQVKILMARSSHNGSGGKGLQLTHNRPQNAHAPHWALLPFVAGVLIGLAFSTVILIRPYAESVTNVYIRLPEEEPHQDWKRLLEELQHYRVGGVEKLSQEVVVKDPVYYAVIMNDRHSSERLEVLRNSWTTEISPQNVNFFIPAEEEGPQANDDHGNEEDLHYGEIGKANAAAVVELPSHVIEIQALKYVCKHKINNTKWFLVVNDDVYVKPRALESFLQKYETMPHMSYLGKPVKRDPIGRVCLPGPGTVLSYSTLAALCPKLDACYEAETEFVIGECNRKQLDLQCIKDGEPHDLFLKFDSAKKGPITEPRNHRALEVALTVYPVRDPRQMYHIHQFVTSRLLNETQHEVQELKLAVDHMTELLPRSDVGLQRDLKSDASVTSKGDISTWNLINHNLLMSTEENSPSLNVPAVWKNEVNMLIQKALQQLNSRSEEKYVFKKVVNAYWKLDPSVGIDYTVDFEATKAGEELDFTIPPKRYKVDFMRPLNSLEVSPVQPYSSEQHVNIAVFLTSEYLEQFQGFVKKLEKVLEYDQRMNLWAVQMRSASEIQKPRRATNVMDPKAILSLYETKYPRATFKVIDSPNLLSRAHGISLVIRDLRPSEILFLADLDLEFDTGFIERCRNYPLQGQQAYFPIPFAKVDPSILSHTMLADTISHHSGYWLVHSYSIACIYAADILATTSLTSFKGIPNEVNTKQVLKGLMGSEYEIIRPIDKGLKRAFSQRTCDLDLYGEVHVPCELTGEDYGSLYLRSQLSVLLFDHEGDYSDTKF